MTYRCLIVDDEPLASNIIKRHFSEIDHYEVVATANNATAAYNILKEISIDLIILDINMPGISGIEFVRAMDQTAPEIIISTAYRDYALEGYELNVLDYLLKPYSFERFFKAVSKFQSQTHSNGNGHPKSEEVQDEIYLKSDKKMIRVKLDDIIFVESLKDYIRVKTSTQEVISHQKISYMEERLPESKFLRIHRSFIISLDKINAFSATVVELQGHNIPIGRNYKNTTLEILKSKAI